MAVTPDNLGDPPSSPTVDDVLAFLGVRGVELSWPPDIFAVAAILLEKSGAYIHAIEAWPPVAGTTAAERAMNAENWTEDIRQMATEWRESGRSQPLRMPTRVEAWWTAVVGAGEATVESLKGNKVIREALLHLCAVADEASRGFGIPSVSREEKKSEDEFVSRANTLLLKHTLGSKVSPRRVCVLPKLHTPQNGMTIRSLSHNLAVCPTGDVTPRWHQVPAAPLPRLNILLVPWPRRIRPRQFSPVPCKLENMGREFGFFKYSSDDNDGETAEALLDLVKSAERVVDGVDMVVLPEMALTEKAFEEARGYIAEQCRIVFIAGVHKETEDAASNYTMVDVPTRVPTAGGGDDRVTTIGPQQKHHRWKLDRSQIVQYGLGGSLDPTRAWWESISLEERDLWFVSLSWWLTVSVLLCEDLARQDPVAQVLRAVGPNLVIALLMDGPQLNGRWPARYATVLADDPGSSVLTLTSLGMARLCRPPGKGESHCIALWKDAIRGETVEIELEDGADAMVISIAGDSRPEWTADGRKDYGTAGYPILAGVHAVRRNRASGST